MFKHHGLHVELELEEEPHQRGVDLGLCDPIALEKVKVVLDVALQSFGDELRPLVLGDGMEILGHDSLSLHELIVSQRKLIYESMQLLSTLDFPEISAMLV
jgi:hypothetical protein